jgi:hypothetical protein
MHACRMHVLCCKRLHEQIQFFFDKAAILCMHVRITEFIYVFICIVRTMHTTRARMHRSACCAQAYDTTVSYLHLKLVILVA